MLLTLLACTANEPEVPAAPPPPVAPARDDLPNIVLISMDTMRGDRLGSMGYHRSNIAPFLDELAAAGVQFENAYSQAPSTLGTHTSLFTGTYVQTHQVFGHHRQLEPEALTLAEHLTAHGYATYSSVSSLRFMPEIGINQGFATFNPFWDRPKNERSDAVTDTFHAYAAQQRTEPVFAFLHYFDAHAPYNAPEPFTTRYSERRDDLFEPRRSVDFLRDNRYTPVSAEELAWLEALYDAGVSFLDDELRRLYENTTFANGRPTLWIFTSDHGEEFKEQGYLGHSTWMHEELLRIPLIMVGPGMPAGRRTDAYAQSADLFPTLTDLLDLPTPPGMEGRSLRPALTGEGTLAQPYPGLVDVIPTYEGSKDWAIYATIDGTRFKLVKQESLELTLHRVDFNPGLDVIVKHQVEAGKLLALSREMKIGRKRMRESGHRDVDFDELEALRAMGYIDEVEHIQEDH